MNNKPNFFQYVTEYVKSKTNKDYVLSSNSPARMLNNHDLLIKTIKQNPAFIEELPEETLFRDDIYIQTAVEAGYNMDTHDKFKSNARFVSKYLDFCAELPPTYCIDSSVFDNQEVRDKFLLRAKKEKLLIQPNAPQFLKDDPELAIEYFRYAVQEKRQYDIRAFVESILSKELMKNDWFIKEFISLCNESGIGEHEIIDMIQAMGLNMKDDVEIINAVFDNLSPKDIKYFFEKMNISNDELKNAQSMDISGNLKKLQEIAKYNPIATSIVEARLLDDDIPVYKKIKYSGDVEFQQKLFSLPQDRYELFLLLSNGSEGIVEGWEKIDYRLVENLSEPYYAELINSIVSSVNNGQEMSAEEIKILKKLLTQACDHYYPEYGDYDIYSNNIFNITTREELKNYDNIKNTICKLILDDPYLKNIAEYPQYEKYLNKFKTLEPIDRLKLALIEIGFDMNMEEARSISASYNSELLNISDKSKQAIINQARVINYIINSNSIEELQQLGRSKSYYHLDFEQTMALVDDIARIVEEDIAEKLYSPKQEDFIDEYEGVKIYGAPLDFETISKFAGDLDKKIWDSSYSSYGFGGKESFRIATSMSYTNGELLNPDYEGVTIGIGRNIVHYKMTYIIPRDGHTDMSNSPVYDRPRIESFSREDIAGNTDSKYNELVVYTLSFNPEAESYDKMQPEYFIYYQKKSDMTIEERNNDEYWRRTVEKAKEFGVPIVIIDCEAVRKHEFLKIKEGIEKERKTLQEGIKLVTRIKHYKFRYGSEEIEQLLAEKDYGGLDSFVEYVEELEKRQQEELEKEENVETIIKSIEELKEYQPKKNSNSTQEQRNDYTR